MNWNWSWEKFKSGLYEGAYYSCWSMVGFLLGMPAGQDDWPQLFRTSCAMGFGYCVGWMLRRKCD